MTQDRDRTGTGVSNRHCIARLGTVWHGYTDQGPYSTVRTRTALLSDAGHYELCRMGPYSTVKQDKDHMAQLFRMETIWYSHSTQLG